MCAAVGSVRSIRGKNGAPSKMLSMTLVDRSLHAVELTVWGDEAERWGRDRLQIEHHVVGLRGCRVEEYMNGRTLGCTRDGTALAVLGFESWDEARALAAWYAATGYGAACTPLGRQPAPSPRRTLAEMTRRLSRSEGNRVGRVVATVVAFPRRNATDHPWYRSCQQEHCSKKIVDDGGVYYCSSCKSTSTTWVPRSVLLCRCSLPRACAHLRRLPLFPPWPRIFCLRLSSQIRPETRLVRLDCQHRGNGLWHRGGAHPGGAGNGASRESHCGRCAALLLFVSCRSARCIVERRHWLRGYFLTGRTSFASL